MAFFICGYCLLGLGLQLFPMLNNKCQNMEYLHKDPLKYVLEFLDQTCNTHMLDGKIGADFFFIKLIIPKFGSQNICWLMWSIAFEMTLFSYGSIAF
jgi:hypothetical protein